MNHKHHGKPLLFIPWYLLILIVFALVCAPPACKWLSSDVHKDRKEPRPEVDSTSWNVLFRPGTDKLTRDQVISAIKDHVNKFYEDYNNTTGKDYKPRYADIFSCPCDTLLYNIGFASIDGAGKSVTTPPPSKPGPAGSGDFMNAVVSNNAEVTEPISRRDYPRSEKDSVARVRNYGIDASKVLAIIDAGIDLHLFTPNIAPLIWRDIVPATTLFNFLPGRPTNDLFDQTLSKHGSAVAAIAVKAMQTAGKYPRLMILKALDSVNRGSIFSVSCALSYAIQKKASLINMSLGYYGGPDSILHHYLGLCAKASPGIPVFVAAGNTPGVHNLNLCGHNNNNLLSNTRLFYPACFSNVLGNITTVTQISKEDSSCFYQNYSNKFVNLGILNTSNCCAIPVAFLPRDTSYYEGSSFATPAASGLRMGTFLMTNDPVARDTLWKNLMKADPQKRVTIEGKYIEYAPTGN